MAAKKLTAQQQRDRRAKIMLGALGGILLLVLGLQLPKLMGGSGGGAPAAASTTAPSAATPAAALVSAAPSTLQRFTRFAAKDPFKAGVKAQTTGTTTAAATTTTPNPKAPAPQQKPPASQPPIRFNLLPSQKQAATPTGPLVPAALLLFNGKKHVVALGETFPAKHPLFRLVSLGKDGAWVRLIGGSFANGQQTLKLVRGRQITLENTTARARFVLKLVKPTVAPKPVTVATAPTAAVQTTPTTTSAAG